jgi:hypothetical protein
MLSLESCDGINIVYHGSQKMIYNAEIFLVGLLSFCLIISVL